MKKKKQASDDSIETKKSEQLQKFRSLASIRKGLSDTAVNTKTQSDTKTQSAYSDINSPQMKAQGEQYYDNVRKYIMEFWSYPDMGKKSMLAIISFSVDVNGSISNIRIEKSSGDSLYDSQARYAVIKSNPLPKPPFEMELGIRFSQ
ncbi:MAG: TonB C-terminal domain-containing protein [Nitrospirae bacterium]|nr:TonB C-terminal domain-containing protein [Nitrospirota bacterium]